MKTKTKIWAKYFFAMFIAILSLFFLLIFSSIRIENNNGGYILGFSIILLVVSYSWIVFSNKGKLHSELRKLFWSSSLLLVFLTETILFLSIQFNIEFFSVNFLILTILIILFFRIVQKKDNQIGEKEKKAREQKEWEDSKPLHEKTLQILYDLLEDGILTIGRKYFEGIKPHFNLLELNGLCTIYCSYKSEYAIIMTKENLANLNHKINVPEFIDADFSDKKVIESYSEQLFKPKSLVS